MFPDAPDRSRPLGEPPGLEVGPVSPRRGEASPSAHGAAPQYARPPAFREEGVGPTVHTARAGGGPAGASGTTDGGSPIPPPQGGPGHGHCRDDPPAPGE